jgi:hypothetical protein
MGSAAYRLVWLLPKRERERERVGEEAAAPASSGGTPG